MNGRGGIRLSAPFPSLRKIEISLKPRPTVRGTPTDGFKLQRQIDRYPAALVQNARKIAPACADLRRRFADGHPRLIFRKVGVSLDYRTQKPSRMRRIPPHMVVLGRSDNHRSLLPDEESIGPPPAAPLHAETSAMLIGGICMCVNEGSRPRNVLAISSASFMSAAQSQPMIPAAVLSSAPTTIVLPAC